MVVKKRFRGFVVDKGVGRLILLVVFLGLIISFTYISLATNLFSKLCGRYFELNLIGSTELPWFSYLIFLGDINGDKKSEIVFYVDIIENENKEILIFDASAINRGPVAQINLSKYVDDVFMPFRFDDVNSDGILDIIIVGRVSDKLIRILCLAGDTYTTLWSTELNVTNVLWFSSGSIDVNGDGIIDIIICNNGDVFAVNGLNGSLLWKGEEHIVLDRFRILTGDVNGDGRLEIILISLNHIYALASSNGTIYWHYFYCRGPTVDVDSMRVTLHDINGDGCDEIIYAKKEYGVYCISAEDGRPKYLWLRTTPHYDPRKLKVVFERGKYLVIVFDHRGINAFAAENGEIVWSRDISIYFGAIEDINDDGSMEILGGENTTFYYLSAANGLTLHTYSPNTEYLLSKVPESENQYIETHGLKIHTKSKSKEFYVLWYYPMVYDLDNSGKKEVIVGVHIHKYGRAGNFILILSSRGWKLGDVCIDNGEAFIEDFKCFDIDGDGIPEIIVMLPCHLYIYKIEIK